MPEKLRIAVIVSHPIQHFCPQYASFAQHTGVECKVFFASMLGFKKYIDPDFKQEISWGNLGLDTFEHVFLNGDKVIAAGKEIDAPALDEELNSYKPDAIIVYGYFQRLQRRAHAWGRRRKVPIIYISDSERRQHRNWLKEMIKYPFVRKYFSAISCFLSVGDANEEAYRHYGVSPKKIIRMHFPIDVQAYNSAYEQRADSRQQIREKFGIREDRIVLSVVGKLVPWKNQEHIIEAMQQLEAENIYTDFFVLGSGNTMDLLQQKASALVKSKVHFSGFVPADQLPAFYAATDIYVHPASVEPHSIAISEAVYMGCPVIISNRCGSYGANDDVQEGKNGFVYSYGDINQLAEKIKWLVQHPHERRQFGLHSHTIAASFQQRSHYQVLDDLIKFLQP